MPTETPARPDPEQDRARALRYAARQVKRWRKAEQEAANAIWHASRQGASLREIEAETGVNYRTVARIIGRHDDDTSPA